MSTITTFYPAGGGIGTFENTSNICISDDNTAGSSITTGNDSVLLGSGAGASILGGANNVLLGLNTGGQTSGIQSQGIGNEALRNCTTGHRNIGIGQEACKGNAASKLTGTFNIGLGYQAGLGLTTGTENILIGSNSGDSITTATGNCCIGKDTGQALVDDSYNAFVGYQAGRYTTGAYNIGIGYLSLTGSTGTPLTGANNVAIGQGAGYAVEGVCNNNVLIGYHAGVAVTTGDDNTYVGYNTAAAATTGGNNTCLGNAAAPSSATVSNEFVLGNSSVGVLRCQQSSISALSDERDKSDIEPLNAGIDFINQLNPVRFTWSMREESANNGTKDTGFIAQELKQVQVDTGIEIPKLIDDANPDRIEASYGKLLPVAIKAIQELSIQVEELKQEILTLKGA